MKEEIRKTLYSDTFEETVILAVEKMLQHSVGVFNVGVTGIPIEDVSLYFDDYHEMVMTSTHIELKDVTITYIDGLDKDDGDDDGIPF